jgi:hypothetical protein
MKRPADLLDAAFLRETTYTRVLQAMITDVKAILADTPARIRGTSGSEVSAAEDFEREQLELKAMAPASVSAAAPAKAIGCTWSAP